VRRCVGQRLWRETRIGQKVWWWWSSECRWDEQESGYKLEPDRSWRRSSNLIVSKSSHGCDGQDSGLEWYERSALCNLRRDANHWLRAVPSHNMASISALAIASLSGASRRGRQATGGPGVVRMWWTVLWSTSRWTPVDRVKSENSERMLWTGVLALTTLTPGIRELAAWVGADKDVTPSSRGLYLQSTKSP
jgi:hypothetical protein